MMTAMRPRPLLAVPALLAAGILVPGSAHAAPSPDLWATVNICDTATNPNTIGIRASIPGTGKNHRMYMRFEAQFFDRTKNRFVPSGSSSKWSYVGSARFRSVQFGFSFAFAPPPAGEQFVFRGKVDFRWRKWVRRNGRKRLVTVMRRSRITRAGFTGVEGGDPPGRSEALCVIR